MTDLEILIMDGTSNDNTLDIVNSYHDTRIKVYSEPDEGIYDAMNKGIGKAQGEWLYFIGSDDYLCDANVFKKVFSKIEITDDIIYGNVVSKLPEKNYGEWSLETLEYNRCHQAIFYKKDIFEKFGLYNLKYKILADHDFNLNWMLNSYIQKKYIDLSIAYYNCNGISSKSVNDGFYDDLYYKILHWPNLHLPIELRIKYTQKATLKAKNIIAKTHYQIIILYLRLYRFLTL